MTQLPPATVRAVVYYRKSNDDGGESIDQQREWAQRVCPREGIALVAEFSDQSKSGWDTARRTDFHKMIAFCEEQARLGDQIDAIVCWHPNRFSRSDSLETAAFLHRFREVGVCRMFTQSHGWKDFRRPEDRIIFGVEQEAGSHRFVRDLAANVLRGRKALAKKGLWCGGKPPFGYSVEGQKLVVHPVNGAAVRWVFDAYTTRDVSLSQLCEELSGRGVKTPRGGAVWCRQSLVQILRNPLYLGAMVWNRRTESPFLGSVKVEAGGSQARRRVRANPEADWVRVPDTHSALVTQTDFDRAQARLISNRGRTTPVRDHAFLLVGMLRCGNCQAPMVGRSLRNGKKKGRTAGKVERYYACSRYNMYGKRCGCNANMIREDRLVAAVAKKLAAAYFNADAMAAIRAEAIRQEGSAEGTAAERALKARYDDLERKIRTGTDRLMSIDDALFEECHQRLLTWKAELAEVAQQLERSRARKVAKEDLDARVETILTRASRFHSAILKADPAAARAALREMVERIEVVFTHTPKAKHVRSQFARGLIYVHPHSFLVTDLSNVTTSPSPTAR